MLFSYFVLEIPCPCVLESLRVFCQDLFSLISFDVLNTSLWILVGMAVF